MNDIIKANQKSFLVIDEKNQLQKNLRELTSSMNSIGLVPTMGNLHDGHLSLLRQSLIENELTVITIFVNPLQFGKNEDFGRYPRTLPDDQNKILKLYEQEFSHRTLILFAPKSIDEMYPQNFQTTISVGHSLTQILCGKVRPTHFDGVTTIVYKLFSLVKPHNAYFGQKDYQQCIIIKKMVLDLELPIHLKILPISRNEFGLALSSRNQYLTGEETILALTLHKALRKLRESLLENFFSQSFLKKTFHLREEILKDERFEYLEILDGESLEAITSHSKKVAILGVFRLNGTRLLDNEVVDIHAR